MKAIQANLIEISSFRDIVSDRRILNRSLIMWRVSILSERDEFANLRRVQTPADGGGKGISEITRKHKALIVRGSEADTCLLKSF